MEKQALRAEGVDPDNPEVVSAIAVVRWELSLLALSCGVGHVAAPAKPILQSGEHADAGDGAARLIRRTR